MPNLKHASLETIYWSIKYDLSTFFRKLRNKPTTPTFDEEDDGDDEPIDDTSDEYEVTFNTQLDSLNTVLCDEKLTKDIRHLKINNVFNKWENFTVLSKHLATLDLSNLTSLTIWVSGRYLGDGEEAAKILAQLPQLSNLTELGLIRTGIGDKGAFALSQSPHLAKLTNLRLIENISDEGIKALTQLSNLRQVDFSNNTIHNKNHISNESVKALAQLSNLTELSLCSSQIDDNIAKDLAQLTNLQCFCLSGSKMGDESAKALAQLPDLTLIACYSGSMIGDEGAKALAQSPKLTHLMLEASQIGNEGVLALAAMPNLTRLFLMDDKIDMDGIKSLAALPNIPKSTHVTVKKKRGIMARIFKKTLLEWSAEDMYENKYVHEHYGNEELQSLADKNL